MLDSRVVPHLVTSQDGGTEKPKSKQQGKEGAALLQHAGRFGDQIRPGHILGLS